MKSQIRILLRLLPLILLFIAIALAFYFKLDTYLTFAAIKTHKNLLNTWVSEHYVLSVLFFMLAYIVVVLLSIPAAVFLTLTAGFLFGVVFGTIYVVVSATIGSTCIFLIVQLSLGKWLAEKNVTWVAKMQNGFQKNALQYLLFLRLVPLFPFYVVNIVPGILNIKKSTFIVGTFLGIIPGSFVYTMLGNGLGYAFSTGKAPNLSIIFEPQILWPMIGLATLSLVPIAYKKLRGKHHGNGVKS